MRAFERAKEYMHSRACRRKLNGQETSFDRGEGARIDWALKVMIDFDRKIPALVMDMVEYHCYQLIHFI